MLERQSSPSTTREPADGHVPDAGLMAQIREALCSMVDEELADTPFTGTDCPWIDGYVQRYSGLPEEEGHALVQRWTGQNPRGMSNDAITALIVQRARRGVREWREGGQAGIDIDGTMVEPLRIGDGTGDHPGVAARDIAGLRGGQPVGATLRSRAESALGGSFADVRIHDGTHAASLASRAHARAFTVGDHIVMGSGATDRATRELILLHELAHVRQQREQGLAASTQALEDNADALAEAALTDRPLPPVRPAGGLRLQRCGESDPNMGIQNWPGERLSPGQIDGRYAEYQLAIAVLDARMLDLQAQGGSEESRAEVTATREAFQAAMQSIDQARPHLAEGEDLAWFESQLGWAGWLPMHLAVQQATAEADPAWQRGVQTARRYQILRERDGYSPAGAMGAIGLVTAGEFVGVTQLAEAFAGREAITLRELNTGERVLRGISGAIAVASLTAGMGGPRLGGWAQGLRVPQVRYMATAGGAGRFPVLVWAEGAAPLALTQSETLALSQAGLINLAMMSSSGSGSPTPSSPSSGRGSGSPRPANADPGGRGNYHLDDATIDRLPDADAARLRELQSRVPASAAELEQLVELRRRASGGHLPTTPGTPEHMLARWRTYETRPDRPWNFQRWASGHSSRMRNSVGGVAREDAYRSALADVGVEAPSRVRRVGDQPRQVDLEITGAEGMGDDLLQIKSGTQPHSLTTRPRESGGASRGSQSLSNADALDVDRQLIRQGNRVHWIFESRPTGPLARRAIERGVSVTIRVENQAARTNMIQLMRSAGMNDAQISQVRFVEGSLDDIVEAMVVQFGRRTP